MSNGATKKLTESALLMAVSLVLFLGAFVPVLGILIAPFSPVPLCMLAMKYGPRHGALVGATTVGVLSVLFSPVLGGAFVPFVYVGLVLGVMGYYKASGPLIWTVGTASTVVLLWGLFIAYDGYAAASGTLPVVSQTVDRVFADVGARLQTMGAQAFSNDPAAVRTGLANLEILRRFVQEVLRFPLAFFASLAALGFSMSYYVASRLLDKMGFELAGLPPFSTWRSPWYLSWGFIASYLFFEYCFRTEFRAGRLYALNVLGVFLMLYVVMGLAIVEHYLALWGVPLGLRVIVGGAAAFLLTFPPVPLLTAMGVLDPWIDFRKIGRALPSVPQDGGGFDVFDD